MPTPEEVESSKKKEAIQSMRGAAKNMTAVLDRVDRLERALAETADNLKDCKEHIGQYSYLHNSTTRVHAQVDNWIAEANKVL